MNMSEKNIYVALLYLVRIFFILVLPIFVAITAMYLYAHGGAVVETENAYIKADIVIVSPEVSSRVTNVEVEDNQFIEKGALLFGMEHAGFVVEKQRAEAQMGLVRAEVASLKAEYQVAQVEKEEVKSMIAFQMKQLKRQETLREHGMGRADQYDEALHRLELANAHLTTLDKKSKKVLAGLLGDPNLNPEKDPKYLAAVAIYDTADLGIKDSFVYAPVSGIVSNMKLQAGEYVNRGTSIFSIISSDRVWIEANFKETQLTWMKVGQKVEISVDAYPDFQWNGIVATIAPATGAEFAILPPQNATGNWVKVVQRLPVHIAVEQPEGLPPLRAGMTVTVGVSTGVSRGLPRPINLLVAKGWLPEFLKP
ncbi:MAG: HlyD family secretion protein [Proteobacteria bacterium]|nr:HlyD family secretion protein [Pseudomonadota bacterium]